MGRIIFDQNEYYEESSLRLPVKNGRALFRAQFEHDLKAARKDSEKLNKMLPRLVAERFAWGFAIIAIGAFCCGCLLALYTGSGPIRYGRAS